MKSDALLSHKDRIVAIARLQKLLTLPLAGLVVSYFIAALIPPLIVASIVGVVVFLAKMIQFMRLVGIAGVWLAACCVFLFLPLLQLVVLVVANYRASEILRAAGLRVGAFGVSDDELTRFELET